VDWRLEHAIYDVSLHHHWVGSLFHGIEQASIPVMVVLTGILWFLSRPAPPGEKSPLPAADVRGDRKWKLACGSGYLAAALAYAVAFVIHHLYDRARPYEAHAIRHPWSSSTDASFPSDHTSLSFAIAFAVLTFDTVAGVLFLAVAAIIGVGRLFIGAHYPGDVLMGVLVGGVVAFVVVRFLRGFVAWVVGYVERVTDPLVSRSRSGPASRSRSARRL
jgi:membrane-associated phospholipid phosphatase